MSHSARPIRFPWTPAAVALAVAGGATYCAASLPPAVAAGAVGLLALVGTAVGWWAGRAKAAPSPLTGGPAPVSDSLPPGSAARMRILESAVVHAHDAVAILDATAAGSGRPVVYVNEAFCKLTGYAKTEIIGRSLHALRGPDSDPDTLGRLRTAMDAGHPLRVELRNYRKDGTPYWVDLSAVPVSDEAGRITHWLLIQRDIDRRKSAERRARQTGQLLRAIIDAFPGPISAKDRDSRYLVMNQFQAELLGTTPEAAVGRTAAELTDPAHGVRTAERDRQVIATCRPLVFETAYPSPGGEVRPWLTTKAPLWMPDGIDSEPAGARGVVTVAQDISALKAAEGALRRSEERYRQLFKAIPHPVFVYDAATHRILSVNEATVRKYGWTRDELLSMSMTDVRAAGEVPRALGAPGDSGIPDGPPAPRRHVTKGGAVMDVDVSSFCLNLEGRAVKLALVNDVTDRCKAEAELRRSEGLFRGIFESTGAGVTLTDASGLFVASNPAFAAMVGRTVDEVLKLTPHSITHPDDMPGQLLLWDEVRAGRRDRFNYSKRYVRPDGEAVWTELSFTAIRTPDGAYEYGLGVSVDVSERRKLEDQLRQVQKLEAFGQMAGGIAHDFNNILTAVIGNLSLVRLPDYDPNKPLLAAVDQAAHRAADLTRKLLGYARRNQLVFAPVEPKDALNEVVTLLRRTLDPRIKLHAHVDPMCPAVHADVGLLAQALMNLCLNARDAMPGGGTLALTAEPVVRGPGDPCPPGWGDLAPGAYVRLAVADTGEGMTGDVLARMFEPFFTTKGVGKGTGLGLPMVQGIVKQHHGWIEIHSRPGAGTRIELNLPVAEVTNTPAVSDSPTPLPTGLTAPLANAPRPPKPLTVLLVDDESMIRDLGRAVLSRAGFRVLTAEDGADAVEVYARQWTEIDLVILDVMMPRMNGRDAFRALVDINPAARILFSTGYTAEDLVEVDGAAGLLNKPYRPQELVAAVRTALAVTPQPT